MLDLHISVGIISVMNNLHFTNPVFRYSEVNVTVRLGTKWAGFGVQPGTPINLYKDPENLKIDEAVWSGCCVFNAHQLQTAGPILRLEHDPSCRTFEGLIEELASVYNTIITPTTLLTVVFFVPIEGGV